MLRFDSDGCEASRPFWPFDLKMAQYEFYFPEATCVVQFLLSDF